MIIFMFILLAFGPLAIDMYMKRGGDREVTLSESAWWSAVYVGSAMLFMLFLFDYRGPTAAGLFFSGYVIEKSLSVDNLLVFAAIFAYFGIERKHQYKVLHAGIIGSVILRLTFVATGLFLFFIFGRVLDIVAGLFVIWTASQMEKDEAKSDIDHNKRWYIRWTKRILPVTGNTTDSFFVREKFGWFDKMPTATPLFLCLIAIEITDIAFAFDSVPAVIGITKNFLIAFSAIMFAVIGLRSLFFVLDAALRYTAALQKVITVVLLYVGMKMVIRGVFKWDLPAWVTIVFICIALGWGAVGIFIKPTVNPAEKTS